MASPEEMILKVGGLKFEKWKEVSVTRQLDAIAGSFEFTASVADKSAIHNDIFPGAECAIVLGDDIIITGIIDDVEVSYDVSGLTFVTRGRDKTGQLVDCSADPESYNNINISELAEKLCKPFGIEVFVNAPLGKAFPKYSVEPGATAFEALETAARMRAVLLTSDGDGSLIITRAGGERIGAVLKRGVNILNAGRQTSQIDRYGHYTVLGKDLVNDNNWRVAHKQKGVADDPGINPRRKLIIIAEDNGSAESFKERAVWESVVRYGRSHQILITTYGWRHHKGIWKPNQILKVQDDWLGVDGEFLISEVVFQKSEQGTLTNLTLVPPEVFDLIPLSEAENIGIWDEPIEL